MGGIISSAPADDQPPVEDVKTYCKDVPWIRFYGQTSSIDPNASKDQSVAADANDNLGIFLMTLDKAVRKSAPAEFSAGDAEFLAALKDVAPHRINAVKKETREQCFERLKKDSVKFEKIFRERAKVSEAIGESHFKYWASRQQLLFGKVVVDWLESCTTKQTPMDPIYGVLLNPSGGRVGPGDTGWFHNLLYDDTGSFACHSAVHDGFGYLKSTHDVGPGYDYLEGDFLGDSNPLAGQLSGISFWNQTLAEMEDSRAKFRRV